MAVASWSSVMAYAAIRSESTPAAALGRADESFPGSSSGDDEIVPELLSVRDGIHEEMSCVASKLGRFAGRTGDECFKNACNNKIG